MLDDRDLLHAVLLDALAAGYTITFEPGPRPDESHMATVHCWVTDDDGYVERRQRSVRLSRGMLGNVAPVDPILATTLRHAVDDLVSYTRPSTPSADT